MQKQNKYLFIDRDGTLIREPEDQQIDSIDKLEFMPGVIAALNAFKRFGYKLVMVSNQDGLRTQSFPTESFETPHQLMLKIFTSQGIEFDDIRICPHLTTDNCDCRKPKVGLVLDYLKNQCIDRDHSFVIGDRETDIELANSMGIPGILFGSNNSKAWPDIVDLILLKPRTATITRTTKETNITVKVNLDTPGNINIATGIGFFDHMLEQVAKHAGISLDLTTEGDLVIDDHHTVEDTAITLGTAIRRSLGDKIGIARYGFLLPMDEALAEVALDLSGRAYCQFEAQLDREKIGELSTELVPHFFESFAQGLKANLHIKLTGENTHHMIEAAFKGLGRSLGQAVKRVDNELPSTKGTL